LASMAWPAFDGLVSRVVLRSTSMTLIQAMRTARHRALAEGRAYAVVFDAAGARYQISDGSSTTVIELPAQVRFGTAAGVLGPPSNPTRPPPDTGVTFRQAMVMFLPNGTLSPGPGTIYLTGRGGKETSTLAISINITGHLRRYRWENRHWRTM